MLTVDFLQTLLPASTTSQPNVREGYVVETSSRYHVVGKPFTAVGRYSEAGAVEIYDSTTNAHRTTINNPVPGDSDLFGLSLAVYENFLAIGASNDRHSGNASAGSVYIYDLKTTQPALVTTLTSPTPTRGGFFGKTLAVDPPQDRGAQSNTHSVETAPTDSITRLLIGDDSSLDQTNGSGAVHVYNLHQSLGVPSEPQYTIQSPTPQENDYFGSSFSLSEGVVVIGAAEFDGTFNDEGIAYVYDLTSTQPTDPLVVLENPNPKLRGEFGSSIAVSEGVVVVGAIEENFGAAYVYDLGSPTPEIPIHALTNPFEDSHEFSYQVAIDDNLIAVSVIDDNTGANDAGTVYVFDLESTDPSEPWATINNPAPDFDDEFGTSISLLGDLLLVGTPNDDTHAEDSGNSYLFDLSSKKPASPIASLQTASPNTSELFGSSIAISGNIVVAGAREDDTGAEDSGAVYVFDTSLDEQVPLLTIHNPTPNRNDSFGSSVGVSGNFIVVGAPFDDAGTQNTNNGIAYVYDLFSGDPSTPAYTLVSPLILVQGHFGFAVAIDQNLVAIGASDENLGIAYIYDLDSATPETAIIEIGNPEPESEDRFGSSIAISDNLVVVGDYRDDFSASSPDSGTAFVFDLTANDPELPIATLRNPTPFHSDFFGFSVSVHDAKVVVGAPNETLGTILDFGSVYVFDMNSTNPETAVLEIENPTPDDDDLFGISVAIHGDSILVGTPDDDANGYDRGSAYLYDLSDVDPVSTYTLIQKPGPTTSQERFGSSVGVSGNQIVVGAVLDGTVVRHAGAAYVYEILATSDTAPDSFAPIRGINIGGSLSSVFQNDDDYLSFKPSLTRSGPPIIVDFNGTSPSLNPTQLTFNFETKATETFLEQVVSLLNYETAEFEIVDTRSTTLSDTANELELSAALNRFVDQMTGEMRARISWMPTRLIRAQWNVSVDRIGWVVSSSAGRSNSNLGNTGEGQDSWAQYHQSTFQLGNLMLNNNEHGRSNGSPSEATSNSYVNAVSNATRLDEWSEGINANRTRMHDRLISESDVDDLSFEFDTAELGLGFLID